MRPADTLAALLPPPPEGTSPAEHRVFVNSLVGVAMRLAGIVHLEDPADAARLLDGLTPERLAVLPLVLAAMVDIDKTPDELLAGLGYVPPPVLQGATAVAPSSVLLRQRAVRRRIAECGTQRGFTSHEAHGEDPYECVECTIAHRAWERDRMRRRSAKRRGLPASVRAAQAAISAQATLPIEETEDAA